MTSLTGTFTGAPDFQSPEQLSDIGFFATTQGGSVAGVVTGPFNCSSFASTLFQFNQVIVNCAVTIDYWDGPSLITKVGSRRWNMNAACGPGSAFLIPNQGRVFTCRIQTAAPVGFACSIAATPSNRMGPTTLAANDGPLVEFTNRAIGAGASVTATVATLYVGPCHLSATIPFASGTIQLGWVDVNNVFHPLLTDTFAAAPGPYFRSPLFVPPAPLLFAVNNNTAGASTFNAYLLPDQWHNNA